MGLQKGQYHKKSKELGAIHSLAPILKNGTAQQQEWIDYAWSLYPSIDMILTFDVESNWANPLIQSGVYLYYDGKKNNICKGTTHEGHSCVRESSYGFCQFNIFYNRHIVEDERFKNAYWQIEQCVERYKNYEKRNIIGSRFYGYNKRKERITKYIK